MLLSIKPSPKPNKRLRATFRLESGKLQTIDFGYKGGETYIDHKNKDKRRAYVARHRPREENIWRNTGKAPASLSRYVLWGPSTDIEKNIEFYKKKYGY